MLTTDEGADLILLGLAISELSYDKRRPRTQAELAYFCQCSRSAIGHIEWRALRKVKLRLLQELQLHDIDVPALLDLWH